jgi:hypothetical protein
VVGNNERLTFNHDMTRDIDNRSALKVQTF